MNRSQFDPSLKKSRVLNAGTMLGLALPLGFGALCFAFLMAPSRVSIPLAARSRVPAEAIANRPRRVALADPPHIAVDGVDQNCNACHQIFASASPAHTALEFHNTVVLAHGMNDRCVNCHDPTDRERLVLRDESTIPFAETPRLCSQCHGTVYRDWQRGTHGKTLGSWITSSPQQRRLGCNECHDPHAPKYTPYVPLPSPHTLRMGEQGGVHEIDAAKVSPLQRHLQEARRLSAASRKKAAHQQSEGVHP